MKKKLLLLFPLVVLTALLLAFGVSASATEYEMGDANMDGDVNTRDVVLIKQSIVGMAELSDKQKYYADAYDDGTGIINARDVVLILQYIVGMDVKLGHTHTLTYHEPKAASCTENGNIAYWSCTVCGKLYADSEGNTEMSLDETIVEARHKMTYHEPKAASCTEDGNIAYWSCTVCGKLYADSEAKQEITLADTVVKASHSLTRHEANEANCTQDGNIEYWSCAVCSKLYADSEAQQEITLAETVIKAAHSLTHHEANAASCTQDGNIEYWSCAVCSKLYADNQAKQEITLADTVVKSSYGSHDLVWIGGEETHYQKCIRVGCDYCSEEAAHVLDDEASCTENRVCQDCEKIVAYAPGHDYIQMPAVMATCTEKGHYAYLKCSRCEAQEGYVEIPALGHSYEVTWRWDGFASATAIATCRNGHHEETYTVITTKRVIDEPTCTAPGKAERTATVKIDGRSYRHSRTETLPELGHKMQAVAAKEPTCTQDGNIEYWSCAVCSKLYADSEAKQEITLADTIVKASHSLTHHEANAANCTQDGNIEYWSCAACSKLYADSEGNTEMSLDETIVEARHKMTYHEPKAASCTQNGNIAYWSCTVCGKLYSDYEGKQEITLAEVTLKARHPDKFEVRNYKPATDYQDGYSGDTYCMSCGEMVSLGAVLPHTSNTPAIIVSDIYAEASTVRAVISIVNNPGIVSLKFSALYSDMLSIQSVEFADAFGAYVTTPEPYINPQTFNWITSGGNVSLNGEFVVITFAVDANVAEGETAEIRIIPDNQNIFDYDLHQIAFGSAGKTITIG